MTPDRAETLARISACAASSASRAERARAVADEIRAAGPYRWVGLYDVDAAEVTIIAWSGGGAPAHPRFPRTQGLTGRAVETARTLVVNDVASDPGYLEAFGDTRSETIVPVVVGGVVVGTVDVESANAGAFDDNDRAFLGACRDAAVALWEDDR